MAKFIAIVSLLVSASLSAQTEWKTCPVTRKQWMPSAGGVAKSFSVDLLDMRIDGNDLHLSGQFWNNGTQPVHDLVLKVIVGEKELLRLEVEESRPEYYRGLRFNLPVDSDMIRFEVVSFLTVAEYKAKVAAERARQAKAAADAAAAERAAQLQEQERRAAEQARRAKEYDDAAPQRAREAAAEAARKAEARARREREEAEEEARIAKEEARQAAAVARAKATCQRLRRQIGSKTLGSLTVDEADRRDACKALGLW
ncbi:MAG: hypothetical protein JNM66_19160 [Bryobacterales bacterium]|nr:hypothetical protein [Bryobacterales bacterium]